MVSVRRASHLKFTDHRYREEREVTISVAWCAYVIYTPQDYWIAPTNDELVDKVTALLTHWGWAVVVYDGAEI